MVCFCSNKSEVRYPRRSDEGHNIKPKIGQIRVPFFTNLQPKTSQYKIAEHEQ